MARRLETLVTLLMIALGLVGYLEAQKITSFSFDTLGSKAIPQGLSVLLLLVGILVLLLPQLRPKPMEAETSAAFQLSDLGRTLVMLVFVAIYILGMFTLRLPVSLMTTAFVVASASLLPMPHRAQGTVRALITGLILGFGVEWIFTRFFFVDLPTLW
ncbi:tripartite tricarboxylate transporter TctB family protein [Marinobacterium rhizophilum]|uniref:Tripartite tricarboxylate transporter TctB family protein n=1 Tax=Marinobacterium rhizophilum TaxID=420402 RepID=A0ABY5HGC3_9GAMM|nr:tripartite tricarboxylate transporter TctB family protein [Marinobacterium rhizophilum]UTW11413.1 tripartite tricarboxylate transporter TctB family protein [Marinobacterium rhizophilum]